MNDDCLFNYIKNNEIDIDIKEQLQDDYKFMMKVIDITNDKNYYNLCSSRVKNNYEFVIFLMNKFSDDKSFVDEVSYTCLQNNRIIDINYKEVLLQTYELLKNEEKSFFSYYYKTMVDAIYNAEMSFINNYKSNHNEDNNILGYGFIFIKFNYKNNCIFLNFFAKKIINEIFFEINFLEDLIHKYFNEYNKLQSHGINNFLISIIEKYDFTLANYVKCNVSLLDDVKENLESIEQNFNTYVKNEKNNLVSFERARKKL